MSDQELADKLQEAVERLNRAIGECERFGLRVDVDITKTRDIGDLWPTSYVLATSYRPLKALLPPREPK